MNPPHSGRCEEGLQAKCYKWHKGGITQKKSPCQKQNKGKTKKKTRVFQESCRRKVPEGRGMIQDMETHDSTVEFFLMS